MEAQETNNASTTLIFEGETLHLDLDKLKDTENKTDTVNCAPCLNVTQTKMAVHGNQSNLHHIKCAVNGVYTIDCRRDKGEIYMPASFVEKYFEVSLTSQFAAKNNYLTSAIEGSSVRQFGRPRPLRIHHRRRRITSAIEISLDIIKTYGVLQFKVKKTYIFCAQSHVFL